MSDAVATLVARARDGDPDAIGALYDRYVDRVYAYIRRRVSDPHLAEDLTGEVFLRAIRRLDRFDWRGVDIGAWLLTIARNLVTDHFKSARARFEQAVEEAPEWTTEDGPEQAALERDAARALERAMARLSPDHREVLELRFIHGLSVAETASIMGRTEGAIKALQYRACRALAELVREEPSLAPLAAGGITAVILMLRLLP